jgi:hypothetical protein
VITLPLMNRKFVSKHSSKSVLGCHVGQLELHNQRRDASADLHCGVCESVITLLSASDIQHRILQLTFVLPLDRT